MKTAPEQQYLELLHELLSAGELRPGRNGVTSSLFGRSMRFDLADGFPLLTTKKLAFRVIVEELLWFLRGETNVRSLQAAGVHIWDEWADENGDLGPIYGRNWRRWPGRKGGVDQIARVIEGLRTEPYSRRHVLTAWNVADIDLMALPPCHGVAIQFHVSNDRRLSCAMYQRSGDAFLGVPFNIASYSLLTMMIARVVGLQPGKFIHFLGDVHLYDNHIGQAREQIAREPRPFPTVVLAPNESIDGWTALDIILLGYTPHAHIKAEVRA